MKAKEIYDFIRNNPAKELKSVELIENYAELLKEDIECVHLFLDDYDIPKEEGGKTLSMVGRIRKLVEKADSNFFG